MSLGRLFLLSLYMFLSSGCQLASLISFPVEKRGVSVFVKDYGVKLRVEDYLGKYPLYKDVEVLVCQGRVLVFGCIPTDVHASTLLSHLKKTPGVREVLNALMIKICEDDHSVKDLWLLEKIKVALFFDSRIPSQNYYVKVKHRVLYLLGIARSQEELDQVMAHIRNLPIRDVKQYVRIGDPRVELL